MADDAPTMAGSGAGAEEEDFDGVDATPTEVDIGYFIRAVACGEHFAAACTGGGDLCTWGRHQVGQLARTADDESCLDPGFAEGFSNPIKKLSLGSDHAAAVCIVGRVYTWGSGFYGQLGNGSKDDYVTPQLLGEGLDDQRAVDVACGFNYTVCCTKDGSVFSWGAASDGQLGHGDRVRRYIPTAVKELQRIHAVACGDSHSLALSYGGIIFSWGLGEDGQLGHGDRETLSSPRALQAFFEAAGTCKAVECGGSHSAAIMDDDSLYTWGDGSAGQLGHGSTDSVDTPRLVMSLTDAGVNVAQVSLGPRYTAAVSTGKALFLWGRFHFGLHLGVAGRVSWLEPEAVTTDGVVESVAAGSTHMVATLPDGAVVQWGFIKAAERGAGDEADRPKPLVGQTDAHRAAAARNGSGKKKTKPSSPAEPEVEPELENTKPLAGRGHGSGKGKGAGGGEGGGGDGDGDGDAGDVLEDAPVRRVRGADPRRPPSPAAGFGAGTGADGVVDDDDGWAEADAGGEGEGGGEGDGEGDSEGGDVGAASYPPSPPRSPPRSPSPAPAGPVDASPPAAKLPHTPALGTAAGGAESLERLAAPDLSPHADPAQLYPDASLMSLAGMDGDGAGGPGAEAAASDVIADLRRRLARAEQERDEARAAAAAWEAEAVGVGERVKEQAAAAAAEKAGVEQAHNERIQRHKGKIQKLAVTLVKQRVDSAVKTICHHFRRHHTTTLAWAFRRWSAELSVSDVVMGESLRGARTPARARAPGGSVARGSRPAARRAGGGGGGSGGAGAGAGAGDGHDAVPLLRCVARLMKRKLWASFNQWKRGADWARAEEVFDKRKQGMKADMAKASKAAKLSQQRVTYVRNVMTGRLIKTQLRYGRDKLVAVLQARQRIGCRVAFERWRLNAALKRRSDSLRRGRVKLQVGLDQVRADRGHFERAQRELARSKQLFSAFVAFHKWKAQQASEKHAAAVAQVQREKQALVAKLRGVLQHMESVRHTQEAEERTATSRGGSVLQDVKALEERILSWYEHEEPVPGSVAAANGGGGGGGGMGTGGGVRGGAAAVAGLPLGASSTPAGGGLVPPGAGAAAAGDPLARSGFSRPSIAALMSAAGLEGRGGGGGGGGGDGGAAPPSFTFDHASRAAPSGKHAPAPATKGHGCGHGHGGSRRGRGDGQDHGGPVSIRSLLSSGGGAGDAQFARDLVDSHMASAGAPHGRGAHSGRGGAGGSWFGSAATPRSAPRHPAAASPAWR